MFTAGEAHADSTSQRTAERPPGAPGIAIDADLRVRAPKATFQHGFSLSSANAVKGRDVHAVDAFDVVVGLPSTTPAVKPAAAPVAAPRGPPVCSPIRAPPAVQVTLSEVK